MLLQLTNHSGDITTFTDPLEAIQNLSDTASEAPNAQHDPHYP